MGAGRPQPELRRPYPLLRCAHIRMVLAGAINRFPQGQRGGRRALVRLCRSRRGEHGAARRAIEHAIR